MTSWRIHGSIGIPGNPEQTVAVDLTVEGVEPVATDNPVKCPRCGAGEGQLRNAEAVGGSSQVVCLKCNLRGPRQISAEAALCSFLAVKPMEVQA